MFERFTRSARLVVAAATGEAEDLGDPTVGTEHLLLALLGPDGGAAADVLAEVGLTARGVRAALLAGRPDPADPGDGLTEADEAALRSIGIDLTAVRARIEASFGAPIGGGRARRPRRRPFAPDAKKVLELAVREAVRSHHGFIGTEHLLLGVIRVGESPATRVIVAAGVDLDALRRQVELRLRAVA